MRGIASLNQYSRFIVLAILYALYMHVVDGNVHQNTEAVAVW